MPHSTRKIASIIAVALLAALAIACQLAKAILPVELTPTQVPTQTTALPGTTIADDWLVQVVEIFEEGGFSVLPEQTCPENGHCYIPIHHSAGMFGGIDLTESGSYAGFGLVIENEGQTAEQLQIAQQLLAALGYDRVAEWMERTLREHSAGQIRGTAFSHSPTIGIQAHLLFGKYEEGPLLVVRDDR
jgi:hypothetical protein